MKEPEAAPCVGCGYCCTVTACPIGWMVWQVLKPCGGLRWDEEAKRFYCGAVLDEPERTKERLKEQLAIGAGCCSPLCNTQREAALKGKLEAYLERQRRSAFDS